MFLATTANKKFWKSALPKIKDHFDISNIHIFKKNFDIFCNNTRFYHNKSINIFGGIL